MADTLLTTEPSVKQIPLSRGYVALVDTDWYEMLSLVKWRANLSTTQIYAVSTNGEKTESMHRVIMDAPKGMVVDHINGNTLDNRRCNLRLCTQLQNTRNRRLQSTPSASRYKGVTWNKRGMKWEAMIWIKRKCIRLGRFHNEKDAARAYNAAALKYFGEFALLNVI